MEIVEFRCSAIRIQYKFSDKRNNSLTYILLRIGIQVTLLFMNYLGSVVSLRFIFKMTRFGTYAVSYTHLDVYKRQVYNCWDCRELLKLRQ